MESTGQTLRPHDAVDLKQPQWLARVFPHPLVCGMLWGSEGEAVPAFLLLRDCEPPRKVHLDSG